MKNRETDRYTPTNPFGTESSIRKDPEIIGDMPVPKSRDKAEVTEKKGKRVTE